MTKEMNLIFDLQLFADATLTGTSAAETIEVATGSIKKNDAAWNPTVAEDTVKQINAGSGNDSIHVVNKIDDFSIVGARGADTITIDSGAGGNTYVYNSGDGKDTIYGWHYANADDTEADATADILKLTTGYSATSMSADGKDFSIKVGSYWMTFKNATAGSAIRIDNATKDGTITKLVVPRKFEGSTKADAITNLAADLKSGTDAATAWVIDAKAGNDNIQNQGSFVSISGGVGKDTITVSAKGTAEADLTSGVTIYGGAGNDSINVTGDTVEGADVKTGVSVAGHVYEYHSGDGKDTILGYNSKDTILVKDVAASLISADVDTYGNYIINLGSGSITIQKGTSELAGIKLNVFKETIDEDNRVALGKKIIDNAEAGTFHYEIPKKKLYSSGANTDVTIDTSLANYTVDAAAGNDSLKVQASGASINLGAGNDTIVLDGGTNVDDSGHLTAVNAVTVIGGYGNDSIDATADKKTVSGVDHAASHVYQFGSADGKDSIKGFNENDYIVITTPNAAISGDFDSTGQHYVIKVGSATLTLENYGGGKRIHVVDAESNIIPVGTEKDGEYYTPNILRGSTGADIALTNSSLNANFTIEGLAGNDVIENQGADNVYIDAGAGNDTIKLTTGGTAADPVYAEDVKVYGGAGNDSIVAETAAGATANTTIRATDSKSHIYLFGANDGNDTINYFNSEDFIQLQAGTYLLNTSVVGGSGTDKDDVILSFAASSTATKATATIRLTGYASDPDANVIQIIKADETSETLDIPKVTMGTTGNDTGDASLSNKNDDYEIYGLAGNDSILAGSAATDYTGNNVSIYAGSGNDTVAIQGTTDATKAQDAYIEAGSGDDKIVFSGKAANATVVAGTGNDSIYSNADGGHTYQFGDNDGINYIFNYQEGDILSFVASSSKTVSTETNADGVVLTFGQTKVILKGTFAGDDEEETDITKYNAVAPETTVVYDEVINKVVTQKYYTVPRQILGTVGNDDNSTNSIVNTVASGETGADDYIIYAKSGNDSVWSNGSDVTIDAGAGNDTVSLGAAAQNNSIYGGTGNDLIFGSPDMGHTYVYNKGDGNDTIVNFTASDVLQINGDYTYENTADGFKVNVGAYSVLLKGTLKSGATEGSNTVTDYETIPGDTPLQISNNGTIEQVVVEKLILGTNGDDSTAATSINVVSGTHDNYTVKALNGADSIQSTANSVLINGGAGADSVSIGGGTDVTVVGGYGNDSIVVAHTAAANGHLFEFALDGSTDILEGVNAEDTIKITGAGDDLSTAIKSTTFTDNYLVLTLKDGNTVIKIKETNGSNAYQKPGTSVSSFYIKLNDGEAVQYNVPNIKNVTGTTAVTLQTTADDSVIVIGNYEANKILNTSAKEVSIYGGGGADSIKVAAAAGSNNTIYAGTGEDTIILEQAGQIIQYKTVDGNDTIFGWQDDDTLQLLDTTSYSTVMSGKTFGIKVGDYTITLYKNLDPTATKENLTAGSDVVKILNSEGVLVSETVPREFTGTSESDNEAATSLSNDTAGYTIKGLAGDDVIENGSNGANVYIDGGSGADFVKTSGNGVTVIGGKGNDTVIASGGSNVSIDGGTGDDKISLEAGVSGATVNGGEGFDTIYSTSQNGNVFVHEANGENEVIFGFTTKDSIKLGAGISLSLSGGEPIVKNSSEGTKLFLSDGTYILLKGNKKISGLSDGQDQASDFEFLDGGIEITIVKNDNTTVAAEVPMTKYTGNTGAELNNTNPNYNIIGSTAIDNVTNSGDNVTINTGKANDYIINTGKNVSISAGSNDDLILIGDGKDRSDAEVEVGDNAQNVTIYGGAGNDTVYGNASGGHVYQFKVNEGADVIYNFGQDDIIEFIGTATSTSQEIINTTTGTPAVDNPNKKDVKFTFGTGTITLKELTTNTKVKYRFGSDGAIQTFNVARVHQLSDSEATESTKYTVAGNGANDDYEIRGKSGDDKADYIINEAKNITINAYAGANVIANSVAATGAIITAGEDNDSIVNAAENAYIDAGAGANTLKAEATATGTTIKGGSGVDSINNAAANVVIEAGSGENIIINSGANTKITTGGDADQITNTGSGSYIKSGDGADLITVSDSGANGTSIEAGLGNDTIFGAATGNRVYIFNSGDGNDVIDKWATDDKLILKLKDSEYADSVATEEGLKIVIKDSSGTVLDAKGSILITGVSTTTDPNDTHTPLGGGIQIQVYGGSIADENILLEDLETPFIKFATADGVNTINNAENYTVQGNNEANAIYITAISNNNVTVDAGAGEDTIAVNAAASVSGGADADTIYIASYASEAYTGTDVEDVTINGGAGADVVSLKSDHTHGIVYEFKAGDGEDTIYNYSAVDTINLTEISAASGYSTTVEGNDFIIIVGDEANNDKIVLKDYSTSGNQHVTIVRGAAEADVDNPDDSGNVDDLIAYKLVEVTAGTDLTNSAANALIKGTDSADDITNTGANVTIEGGADADEIKLTADVAGVVVKPGAGNDQITANATRTPANGVLYVFGANEGTNTITNYSSYDTIQYTGGELTASVMVQNATDNAKKDLTLTFGSTTVILSALDTTANDKVNLLEEGSDVARELSIENITIGTDGDNNITNDKTNYQVQGLGGNDILTNSGANSTIEGGAGADTITNSASYVSIVGGDGADNITLQSGSNNTTVYGGAGIDTITNEDTSNGHVYQFKGDSASNGAVIEGFTAHDTIQVLDDSTVPQLTYTSFNGGYTVLTIGDATVSLSGTGAVGGQTLNIVGADGTTSKGTYIVPLVKSMTADENYTVEADNYYVFGTTAANGVTNTKNNVSIVTYKGLDVITSSGSNVSIDTGDDADDITLTTTDEGITINAGTGADVIDATGITTRANAITYQLLNKNNGNDTIKGFDADLDKLQFTGITTAKAANNSLSSATATLNKDGTVMTLTTNLATLQLEGEFDASSTLNIYYGSGEGTEFLYDEAKLKPTTRLFSEEADGTAESYAEIAAGDAGLTVNLQAGNDFVTVKAKNVNVVATGGGNKVITVNATTAPTSAEEAVTVTSGGGDDTLTASTAYTYISATSGTNAMSSSAANVTLSGGSGTDKITVAAGASANAIYGNAGNDTILVQGTGNTITGGAGDDTFTNSVNGNTYVYNKKSEGTDTFSAWGTNDVLYLANKNMNITDDGTNKLTISYGSYSTTVVLTGKSSGAEINVSKAGTMGTYTIGGTWAANASAVEAPVATLDDILDDDNFISNDTQLSSITEVTDNNYSAGNIESIDFTSLAQNNYTPVATYGSKK